jgi:hypothetical protein
MADDPAEVNLTPFANLAATSNFMRVQAEGRG